MSKNISNISNEFIDPAVLEFKRLLCQKDAQLVWSARAATRRKALDGIADVEETVKSDSPQKPNISNDMWTVMPITDPEEIAEARKEWDRKRIDTAWLVKKAQERLVFEKRLKLFSFIMVIIMLIAFPIMFINVQESTKQKKCVKNMKSLVDALYEYTDENERLPGTLEELIYVASYDVLGDYGARRRDYKCPSSSNEYHSYGINPDLLGKTWDELDDRAIIFADSNLEFYEGLDDLDFRHKESFFGGPLALMIQKDKYVLKYPKPKKSVEIAKEEEIVDEPVEAISAIHYNQCLKEQQMCNRNCSAYPPASQEKMSCTNDCWTTFNRCTQQ